MQNAVQQDVQTVVFRLAEQEYGIDIFKVQEIIKIPNITALPNTADYVKGIINLRGYVIPVIDLKRKFTGQATEYSEETKVIIVEIASKKTGLIVDEVMEVVRIQQDLIEKGGYAESSSGASYLMGIAKLENRLLILLDIDQIMN